MRARLISFLKRHPVILRVCWMMARFALQCVGTLVPVRPKTMLIASFGGRNFDDSPHAIYEEICRRPEFADWTLIWAFVDPNCFEIPRGEKVRIDTPAFFYTLLSSRVWVSNSGMDRGIELKKKGILRIETWHGTPLKKICGDEHQNAMGGKQTKAPRGNPDGDTIRCAQSEYDRELFQRLFHAKRDAILLSDLPRNDSLLRYTDADIVQIRRDLNIPDGKKVVLYTPTYREYLLDKNKDTYIAPPMDLVKWEKLLGEDYVLLFRAHYAVTAALNLQDTAFVRNVSSYPVLNDLYAVAHFMISDYSSTFFDYAILDRPMFCFAYDLEEYEEKRGLYLDLKQVLPCPVDRDEDALLQHILTMDAAACAERTEQFRRIYAPPCRVCFRCGGG